MRRCSRATEQPSNLARERQQALVLDILVGFHIAIYHELLKWDYAFCNLQIGYHHSLLPVSSSQEVRSLYIDLLIQGTLMAAHIPAQTKGTPHPKCLLAM